MLACIKSDILVQLKTILCFLFIGVSLITTAQTAPDKYWVRFSDKANTPFSIENPSAFLSDRALARRERQGIAIDDRDLPVDPAYIQAVLDIPGVQYWHQSNWFNAITVKLLNPEALDAIHALPFVIETRSVQVLHNDRLPAGYEKTTPTPYDVNGYGTSFRQVEMLRGHLLHAAGYRGEGLWVAVMDAGFSDVSNMAAFERARSEGRLEQTANYVSGGSYVEGGSTHGTRVLSTMAGEFDGSFLGTAPDAHYFLFRTEDTGFEYVIEEDNWIMGIEHADRLGIDLVNTSLGYSQFDDPEQDYTPENMDGQTARISIASQIAAEKGMLLVTSAGNRGASDWRVITAPGDAKDVLTVGAVDSLGVHAFFSSFGPSADGRIKPDVVAMGFQSAIMNVGDDITRGNGTSFSAPIVCGLAACLWQAHPQRSNLEIMQAIRESASLYNQPNDSMGYGIPDFWRAHLILRGEEPSARQGALIYPNPAQDYVYVEWTTEASALTEPQWRLIDASGREVAAGRLNQVGGKALGQIGLPAGCANGHYLLELRWGGQRTVERLQILRDQ